MYATINLPGSQHFEYYGPDSKAKCEAWLESRVAELLETEQITSLLPQQVVSDREARSWRYLDGRSVGCGVKQNAVVRPRMMTKGGQ